MGLAGAEMDWNSPQHCSVQLVCHYHCFLLFLWCQVGLGSLSVTSLMGAQFVLAGFEISTDHHNVLIKNSVGEFS